MSVKVWKKTRLSISKSQKQLVNFGNSIPFPKIFSLRIRTDQGASTCENLRFSGRKMMRYFLRKQHFNYL